MDSQPYRLRDKIGLPPADIEGILSAIVGAAEPFDLLPLEIWIAPGSLRLTLDGDPDALSLEHIAATSKAISVRLDLEPSIAFLQQRYELEVSSPGIERPLLNEEQLARAKGSLVELEVRENGRSKRLRGHLVDVSGGRIVALLEAAVNPAHKKGQRPKVGERVDLSLASVVSAKTVFEWPGRGPDSGDGDVASLDVQESDQLGREDLEEDEDNGT